MNIKQLSIKNATIGIFAMVGIVAIILSLFAGSYFKKSAMQAQIGSLSRVIEVASQEILKDISHHSFDLGMKLGYNKELINELKNIPTGKNYRKLAVFLDDPFINGFVGFSKINLVKLRIYSLDLEFIYESSLGIDGLQRHLPEYIAEQVIKQNKTGRLKSVDALWLSEKGPLFSTLVPVGGIHSSGYLEVVVDPVFNLEDIGKISKTPISIYSVDDDKSIINDKKKSENILPVEFVLLTSTGNPALKIIGYEDVSKLKEEMENTQVITTAGFLLLILGTLLFALWLFKKFLFVPLSRLMNDMKHVAEGKLDFIVEKEGLCELSTFAENFELMASQIKVRTNDLQRLLDLDESAILCFGCDGEILYFNKNAMMHFGYLQDEFNELEITDLFSPEDINAFSNRLNNNDDVAKKDNTRHVNISCVRKDGSVFKSDAIINPIESINGIGQAFVLNPITNEENDILLKSVVTTIEKNEQRMRAVEHSLNSILETAMNNPGLIPGVGSSILSGPETEDEKNRLREKVVILMHSILACWEHDLAKNKVQLAEESRIWPVYIDKSTPTTRTLDKYLHIDNCPKNPRTQRVIDTAEFVLKQLGERQTPNKKQLLDDLQVLRQSLSGI